MYDDEVFEEEHDIDFEITFCENLVKNNPDFLPALRLLGDLYTKKGFFEKGLHIDEHLCLLQPEDPFIYYNLACSYSLLNETDKAFRSIKLAIKCGYRDFDYLKNDNDLTNLRNDNRFQRYIIRVLKKIKQEAV